MTKNFILAITLALFASFKCFSQFEVSPSVMMDNDFEPSFSVSFSQYVFDDLQLTYVETGYILKDAFVAAGIGYKFGQTYAVVPSAKAIYISTEGLDFKLGADLRSYRYGVGFGLGYSRILSLEKDLYGFSLFFPF